MTERFITYWGDRSPRERWLIGVMLALLAVVILWLGIVRPIAMAQGAAREALQAATDRHAVIRTQVKQMKALPSAPAAGQPGSIDQLIGQSAGEAGLTLARSQAQGNDRIDIAVAIVRPIALMSWLASLEAQGVRVETISARPSGTAGSVAVEAVLTREAAR
ncbi:MAG: type II secretion system protein M [Sphingobium sp.]